MLQTYCVALTEDLNYLETKKYDESFDATKIMELEQQIAPKYLILGAYLRKYPELTRECVLTAFSLNPTEENFDYVVIMARDVWPNAFNDGLESTDIPQETSGDANASTASSGMLDSLQNFSEVIQSDISCLLSVSRFKNLTWTSTWEKLKLYCHQLLAEKLAIVERSTANANKKLKYINLNYDDFKNLKPHEYPGIEKGYEVYARHNDSSDSSGDDGCATDSAPESKVFRAREHRRKLARRQRNRKIIEKGAKDTSLPVMRTAPEETEKAKRKRNRRKPKEKVVDDMPVAQVKTEVTTVIPTSVPVPIAPIIEADIKQEVSDERTPTPPLENMETKVHMLPPIPVADNGTGPSETNDKKKNGKVRVRNRSRKSQKGKESTEIMEVETEQLPVSLTNIERVQIKEEVSVEPNPATPLQQPNPMAHFVMPDYVPIDDTSHVDMETSCVMPTPPTPQWCWDPVSKVFIALDPKLIELTEQTDPSHDAFNIKVEPLCPQPSTSNGFIEPMADQPILIPTTISPNESKTPKERKPARERKPPKVCKISEESAPPKDGRKGRPRDPNKPPKIASPLRLSELCRQWLINNNMRHKIGIIPLMIFRKPGRKRDPNRVEKPSKPRTNPLRLSELCLNLFKSYELVVAEKTAKRGRTASIKAQKLPQHRKMYVLSGQNDLDLSVIETNACPPPPPPPAPNSNSTEPNIDVNNSNPTPSLQHQAESLEPVAMQLPAVEETEETSDSESVSAESSSVSVIRPPANFKTYARKPTQNILSRLLSPEKQIDVHPDYVTNTSNLIESLSQNDASQVSESTEAIPIEYDSKVLQQPAEPHSELIENCAILPLDTYQSEITMPLPTLNTFNENVPAPVPNTLLPQPPISTLAAQPSTLPLPTPENQISRCSEKCDDAIEDLNCSEVEILVEVMTEPYQEPSSPCKTFEPNFSVPPVQTGDRSECAPDSQVSLPPATPVATKKPRKPRAPPSGEPKVRKRKRKAISNDGLAEAFLTDSNIYGNNLIVGNTVNQEMLHDIIGVPSPYVAPTMDADEPKPKKPRVRKPRKKKSETQNSVDLEGLVASNHTIIPVTNTLPTVVNSQDVAQMLPNVPSLAAFTYPPELANLPSDILESVASITQDTLRKPKKRTSTMPLKNVVPTVEGASMPFTQLPPPCTSQSNIINFHCSVIVETPKIMRVLEEKLIAQNHDNNKKQVVPVGGESQELQLKPCKVNLSPIELSQNNPSGIESTGANELSTCSENHSTTDSPINQPPVIQPSPTKTRNPLLEFRRPPKKTVQNSVPLQNFNLNVSADYLGGSFITTQLKPSICPHKIPENALLPEPSQCERDALLRHSIESNQRAVVAVTPLELTELYRKTDAAWKAKVPSTKPEPSTDDNQSDGLEILTKHCTILLERVEHTEYRRFFKPSDAYNSVDSEGDVPMMSKLDQPLCSSTAENRPINQSLDDEDEEESEDDLYPVDQTSFDAPKNNHKYDDDDDCYFNGNDSQGYFGTHGDLGGGHVMEENQQQQQEQTRQQNKGNTQNLQSEQNCRLVLSKSKKKDVMRQNVYRVSVNY